jgi:putative nucleotidyltransferase with HDIG domain
VPLSVRVDAYQHPDVRFDDFFHLFPPAIEERRSGRWNAMRRWRALLGVLEAFRIREPETWRHSQRVHQHAVALAEALDFEPQAMRALKLTALLHDIGKLAVSDVILNKELTLTETEFDLIRQHPVLGERLVRPLLPHPEVLGGVRHHHERPDGKGYPDGLSGDQIPIIARIISIADVFDALTHHRPYRKTPHTRLEAALILETKTIGQLDGGLVRSFCRMIRSSEETSVDFR